MKLIPVCIFFQALALLNFVLHESVPGVIVFALATVGFGWVCYLERSRKDELQDLRDLINQFGSRVSDVQMRLGLG